MKKHYKINVSEHNDNFYLMFTGMCIGIAMVAVAHLFVSVINVF